MVAVFLLSLVQSCKCWSGAQEGEPGGTIQTCSSCGHRQKVSLSCRTYRCPCCGMEKDRDHNASLNILRLGLSSRGYPKKPLLQPFHGLVAGAVTHSTSFWGEQSSGSHPLPRKPDLRD
ncbi:MAG: zinc ribbon domain-containing protein [Leptospirillum sp.]